MEIAVDLPEVTVMSHFVQPKNLKTEEVALVYISKS